MKTGSSYDDEVSYEGFEILIDQLKISLVEFLNSAAAIRTKAVARRRRFHFKKRW